jgi:DNA excision repair protein ERCC-4
MADNFLWDKESFNPGSDVENPSVSIDNIASAIINNNTSTANARREGIPRSASKAIKLGLVIAALSVALVLGVVLGRNGSSSDDGVSTSAASGTSIAQKSPVIESHEEMYSLGVTGKTQTMQTAIESEPDAVESITTEYYTSAGPLQARVRMVSPSILNGYETCSDLESDITEALKLYMNEFIMNEAVINEMYASCDPENDNWYSDLYGVDYYYNNHDHQLYGELHFCIASRCSSVFTIYKRF